MKLEFTRAKLIVIKLCHFFPTQVAIKVLLESAALGGTFESRGCVDLILCFVILFVLY